MSMNTLINRKAKNHNNLVIRGIMVRTLGWQSWIAATRNPVEALRYE